MMLYHRFIGNTHAWGRGCNIIACLPQRDRDISEKRRTTCNSFCLHWMIIAMQIGLRKCTIVHNTLCNIKLAVWSQGLWQRAPNDFGWHSHVQSFTSLSVSKKVQLVLNTYPHLLLSFPADSLWPINREET